MGTHPIFESDFDCLTEGFLFVFGQFVWRMESVPLEVRKFIAGGMAGCAAKGFVSPLDRIKVLRQGEHSYYGNMSVWKTCKAIVRNEGAGQLWRGGPALLLRIFPYAGLQYYCNDLYRDHWRRLQFKEWTKLGNVDVPLQNLLCGSMAGVTAAALTYPLDTIRTRQLYTSKTNAEYRTWMTTFHTLRSGGISNFYQGLVPALIGMVPYAGISFGTFETLKEMALKMDHPDVSYTIAYEGGETRKLRWYVHSAAGSSAAIFGQLVVYPIDMARRRMQNAQLVHTQSLLKDRFSVTETLADLWRRSPSRFNRLELIYRGFSLNLLRAVPGTAISFTAHEQLRILFGVPRPNK